MIEKLGGELIYDGEYGVGVREPSKGEIIQKINEIIDVINGGGK